MNRRYLVGVIALALSSVACRKHELPAPSPTEIPAVTKKVGVFLFAQHPIIKEINSGFRVEFKRIAAEKSVQVEFVERNADGDAAQAGSIASFFKNSPMEAVVVIGLPAAQKLKAVGVDWPVIFAGVPDPVAAGLVSRLSGHGTNFTGTRYFPPVDANLRVFRAIAPGAKTIAVLHNPAEANSMAVVDEFLKQAPGFGFQVHDLGVTNSVEIEAALRVLSGRKPDGIFIPTDNLVYSSLDRITAEATRMGVPLFNCTRLSVAKGASFSLATDYVRVGQLTAKVAAQVVFGGRRPADLDVVNITEGHLYVRPEVKLPGTLDVTGYPIERVQ